MLFVTLLLPCIVMFEISISSSATSSPKAKLLRAIEKNKSELVKLTTKINNDKFISKAPRTLVEESRDRIVEVGNELNRLIDAQNRIMSIGK